MATSYQLFLDGKDRTGPAINSAKRNFDDFGGSVKRFGVALSGVLGAAGVGALLKNVVDTADRVGKLSDRLGASTEFLSRFNFALEQSGVNLRTGATALQRLTRNASDAASKGVGAAADAMRELGINAEAFTQLPLQQQVLVLAETLDQVDDAGRRVALTQKLMDSEGVALLQTFEGGAAAVQQFLNRADELGRTIDRNTAKQAAELNDRMNELKSSIEGLALQTLPSLFQGLTILSENLRQRIIPNIMLFARSVGLASSSLNEMSSEELTIKLERLGEAQRSAMGAFVEAMSPEEAAAAEQRVRNIASEIEQVYDVIRTRRGEVPFEAPVLPEQAFIDPTFPSEEQREEQKEIKQKRLEEDLDFEVKKLEIFKNLVSRGQRQITKIEKKELTEREKFQRLSLRNQSVDLFGHLAQVTQGVAQHNRALFEINRVAAIANAILGAQEGASRTLAKYPWPLAGILAAIHYAAGVARVSAIVSTSYQGGGSGTAPSLATGGAPVTPVTDTGVTIDLETGQTEQTAAQTPAIQVTLVAEDVESTRRAIDRINEVHKDGYRLEVS